MTPAEHVTVFLLNLLAGACGQYREKLACNTIDLLGACIYLGCIRYWLACEAEEIECSL